MHPKVAWVYGSLAWSDGTFFKRLSFLLSKKLKASVEFSLHISGQINVQKSDLLCRPFVN